MCGICGAISLAGPLEVPPGAAERMIGVLSHRGPDEYGAWRDENAFLGHARLSIVDLSGGQQPLCEEEGEVWITYNGEIYDHPELRQELAARGHRFRTRCDTEVIVHAYEEWGDACVERFNGQFAFALWDRRRQRLLLARDRYGVRPLFVARHGDVLLFGSEVKALLAWPGFRAAPRPGAVAEVFTYWACLPPDTAFSGVHQLPPGHTAAVAPGRPREGGPAAEWPALPGGLLPRRYWHPSFLPAREDHRFVPRQERRRHAVEVAETLADATIIRLRADVPVGAYLSGGLDSSATAALVHARAGARLKTFSVGFADARYDETRWQREVSSRLGTEHCTVEVDDEDTAGNFASVVWHAETPLLRTAPAPLYALSGLVRGESYKVVLTGEGADEVFCGYDIFREAKVRAFWARQPQSRRRPLLLARLYPWLAQSPPDFLAHFYGQGIEAPADPFFSHRPRWSNTGRMTTFLAEAATGEMAASAPEAKLASSLPAEFAGWGVVARAQYLEMATFLGPYLLSSQGDRMLMGHSVEGRFPFLDHRLADLAARIPASIKLEGLREKSILKDALAGLVPEGVLARSKQPYRAPESASFRGPFGQALVAEIMDEPSLAAGGLFRPERVAALARKWRAAPLTSARENMAFVGILSTQLLARQFGPELDRRLEAAALAPQQIAWRRPPAERPTGS